MVITDTIISYSHSTAVSLRVLRIFSFLPLNCNYSTPLFWNKTFFNTKKESMHASLCSLNDHSFHYHGFLHREEKTSRVMHQQASKAERPDHTGETAVCSRDNGPPWIHPVTLTTRCQLTTTWGWGWDIDVNAQLIARCLPYNAVRAHAVSSAPPLDSLLLPSPPRIWTRARTRTRTYHQPFSPNRMTCFTQFYPAAFTPTPTSTP